MKSSVRLIITLSLFALITVSGCRKKETVDVDNETQSAVDNAIADQEYSRIVPTVNSHAINTKGTGAQGGRVMAPCDSLTKISGDTLWGLPGHVSDPVYKITLNSGCALSFTDGKLRSGEWTIRLTGKIKNVGSKMIIKLINHKASGITYACDSMVVTTEAFTPNYVKFKIELINGVCSSANWSSIKYNSTRYYTIYPKGNHAGATESFTELYGTANGTNRQGRKFTINIPSTSPLVLYKSCEYIQKGVMELTPDGFKTRTVDFGYSISPKPYGGCDDDASFTVNGNTVGFKLK